MAMIPLSPKAVRQYEAERYATALAAESALRGDSTEQIAERLVEALVKPKGGLDMNDARRLAIRTAREIARRPETREPLDSLAAEIEERRQAYELACEIVARGGLAGGA